MAFPLIRLYTGDDGESHFEEGTFECCRSPASRRRPASPGKFYVFSAAIDAGDVCRS